MKKIRLFFFESCPYCRKAIGWLEELMAEETQYAKLEIERIDEKLHPEIADKFDYYYVPTFFVGDEKLHEGAATKDKVRAVRESALRG